MIILLTVLSAIAIVALFGTLIAYLVLITQVLDSVGGRGTSFLAKIALGVRAIETQTSALAPQVTQLNEGLSTVAVGLKGIDGHLVAAYQAVGRQEG